MPSDRYVFKILSAGQITWFEADKTTLGEIKAKYLIDAEDFLYFRKGEDWLKHFIDWLLSLGIGAEQILELANECSTEALEFAREHIEALSALTTKDCLDWYIRIAGGYELSKKHIQYLKKKIWKPFEDKVHNSKKKFVNDFRILCKASQENKNYLHRWQAMKTKVRFYKDDADAGSHRFYLHEKGYAIFWRQGKDNKTRFYGFEGTEPEVIQKLKAIFEAEWAVAIKPNKRIKNRQKKNHKRRSVESSKL